MNYHNFYESDERKHCGIKTEFELRFENLIKN